MTEQTIRTQQAEGFRRLKFRPELEQPFRQSRAALIRERARPVSLAALMLFAAYTVMDLTMLPTRLASVTVAIRLGVTAPVIAIIGWLSFRHRPGDLAFEQLYGLAYLIGGLSVVAIIGAARVQGVPLPYEGLLLMLMFGYFAMGLPFVSASLASALIILGYGMTEWITGQESRQLMINLFFILTANTVGMVGAWLSEYRHRAHFLDQQLIRLLRDHAEAESARKTHLITVASHDLRQPLNVIGLTLENLAGGQLGAEERSLVGRLTRTVARFRHLLGTVLDISRINEGMVHAENECFELTELLRQVVDLTVDQAEAQGVRLVLDEPETTLQVRADPQLLLRVLQNLVINALDHSGGDLVTLAADTRGRTIRIDVADNGVGLDASLRDAAFSPFVRGTHTPDQAAGLGLGLAIVHELTGLMGGQCGVEDRPGAGSCFWVTLQAAARPGFIASPAGEPG